MGVLPHREELFQEQFLENPDFERWMEEMGDRMAAHGNELVPEWEALAVLIASLNEGK
jgi:hypothetical protein